MLKGEILPSGSDWQIICSGDVAVIQARYAIETKFGARILVRSDGVRHGLPEVIAHVAPSKNVDLLALLFSRHHAVRDFETQS